MVLVMVVGLFKTFLVGNRGKEKKSKILVL